MKTVKMSLTNVQGKLGRIDMKNIMAGTEEYGEDQYCNDQCATNADCPTDRFCGGGTCSSGKEIKRCNKYA